jgi:2-iminobutanoate/2-iminopropanoate deaminase
MILYRHIVLSGQVSSKSKGAINMNKTVISTKKAPGAIGPYSQGIKGNGFIFVSGQLPVDPATGSFAGETIEAQTEQSLKNVKAILEEAGSDLSKVVKTTVFIQHISDFAAMNGVYAKFFAKDCPARSCFEVGKLPKDALVEIEVIALA